jgi:hypothetical protein
MVLSIVKKWLLGANDTKSEKMVSVSDLVPGDFIRVFLKDPKEVGIISEVHSLSYQRLDEEDIRTRKVDGFFISADTRRPAPGAVLKLVEVNVVKRRGNQTKLVSYVFLGEEIEKIEFLGDQKI